MASPLPIDVDEDNAFPPFFVRDVDLALPPKVAHEFEIEFPPALVIDLLIASPIKYMHDIHENIFILKEGNKMKIRRTSSSCNRIRFGRS